MKDINEFLRDLIYAAKSKKKEDEEEKTEKEVIDEVVVEPVPENLGVSLFPELVMTNEIETIDDLLGVLKNYFKELDLEVIYEDNKIIVPFNNRVLVIGIASPKEIEGMVYNFEDWKIIKKSIYKVV